MLYHNKSALACYLLGPQHDRGNSFSEDSTTASKFLEIPALVAPEEIGEVDTGTHEDTARCDASDCDGLVLDKEHYAQL